MLGELRAPNGGDLLQFFIDFTKQKIFFVVSFKDHQGWTTKSTPIDANLLVAQVKRFVSVYPSLAKVGPKQFTWLFGTPKEIRRNQGLTVGLAQESIDSWLLFAKQEGSELNPWG